MLEMMKGIDLVGQVGGISDKAAAVAVFEQRMNATTLAKINQIKNEDVLVRIANAIVMCDPDSVFVNDGSEADKQWIREQAVKKGEETPLAMKDHTIHFELKEEQGRIVDRTFYIANEGEKLSSMAKFKLRDEANEDIRGKMTGIMKGLTMIIGFYSRGPVGAAASNPALEITSSFYVCHSAELLYRNVFKNFDAEVERLGHFFTNVHSEGNYCSENLPNARVYMDRSFRTTYSMFCTYAGNTLLLKKGNHRFAVDKAVYQNRGTELSEHMFVTGLKGPGGRVTYFSGAAPSGCGKTTTAMVGENFIGDDLAQIWIDDAGIVRSMNPECGIFGIVQDVNWEGDPMLMGLLRKEGTEVIWSNVMVDEAKVPHWVGSGEEPPTKGRNFQGEWHAGKKDANGKVIPVSHANSRCTVTSEVLSNYCEQAENPAGVETRVITYSGRDSDTMPPVWAAKNSDHGVAIGASIVSAATATEVGATGVSRAPWANAPFIPGSLADYMDAQFKFFNNTKIDQTKKPIMAGLNYFLTEGSRGGEGKKLLGEKKDVRVWLGWLELRTHSDVEAIETPIGYLPKYEDLKALFTDQISKEYPRALYDKQFSLYLDNIIARIDLQTKAYQKEENVPPKLYEVYEEQKAGLLALKAKFGPVVTPEQLMA